MTYAFQSRLGKQLYELLPEIYRTRDKPTTQFGVASGDESLAKYLDSQGDLLDLMHATLEQQLKDTLPDTSQQWLLPYFAELLAVKILSPDAPGKHAEVANAVSWRQRKGTLKCVEDIASAIGQMEVEIQEGWKRVAITPRVAQPVLPYSALDNTLQINQSDASDAARHPGLPAVMVDMRYPSRSVKASATNPAARISDFAGITETWRQTHHHGSPCFPGSFDDVSRRTVDFRTGYSDGKANGYYHHKRLLVFAAPPSGLFPLQVEELTWSELNDADHQHFIEHKLENGVEVFRNNTARKILISNAVNLSPASKYRIEGLSFKSTLSVAAGSRLELQAVEADRVEVETASIDEPVLVATDCVFRELSVGNGLVYLDSCSVIEQAFMNIVDVRDSILMSVSDPLLTGSIQYSRIPEEIENSTAHRTIQRCVTEQPIFFDDLHSQASLDAQAVLAPNTPKNIYQGASDQAEMGYFHRGRVGKPVRINGDFTAAEVLHFSAHSNDDFKLMDLFFEGDVEVASGAVTLYRTAMKSLTVNTSLLAKNAQAVPVVNAKDCLLVDLVVSAGLARLEYCTVMNNANCIYLQASDCIFNGSLFNVKDPVIEGVSPLFNNCIRYSVIPDDIDTGVAGKMGLKFVSGRLLKKSNTQAQPVFTQFDFCPGGILEKRNANYDEAGYAVLDPVTSNEIRFGAEDGGEMGVGHHRYYSLKNRAVRDKMREFLPVGIEPVIIQDPRLRQVPPTIST